MRYQYQLMLLGLGLILLGSVRTGWFLLAIWLGCNFLVLGMAHALGAHRVLGKRRDGTLPFWSWLIFFPLHVYTLVVWHLFRLFSKEPAQSSVGEQLTIGRRLLAQECEGGFENYVDLTAEFSEPSAIRKAPGYFSFPILDGAAPRPEALHRAVAELRPGRTFIHCAQGHGRTGLFALAVLLHSGVAATVEDGLLILHAVRPGVCLNREQMECIKAFVERTR